MRAALASEVSEEDLVNSGLEETMVNAFQEIQESLDRLRSVDDWRTAAYVCAIHKVADAYLELGIFP